MDGQSIMDGWIMDGWKTDGWMDRLMDACINGVCSSGILEESPDYIWVVCLFFLMPVESGVKAERAVTR